MFIVVYIDCMETLGQVAMAMKSFHLNNRWDKQTSTSSEYFKRSKIKACVPYLIWNGQCVAFWIVIVVHSHDDFLQLGLINGCRRTGKIRQLDKLLRCRVYPAMNRRRTGVASRAFIPKVFLLTLFTHCWFTISDSKTMFSLLPSTRMRSYFHFPTSCLLFPVYYFRF